MSREPRGWMMFTSIVALFLTVLPLPEWLDMVRPAFVVLAVLYFSITWPARRRHRPRLLRGVALDAFQGPIIGEHALVLSALAYIGVREHQRIRSKPAFQQSLIVFVALVAVRVPAVRCRWLDRSPDHGRAALGAHLHRAR